MKENSKKGLENLSKALAAALKKRYPKATEQEIKGMLIAEAVGIKLGLEPVGEHPDTVASLGEVSSSKRWRERVGSQ